MCLSAPKVPAPTPVIQRQAYKDPVARGSLASGLDPNAYRRMIAGVATSAQGIGPESTTRRVLAGGDQVLAPVLGGGPASGSVTPAPIASGGGPAQGGQTGGAGVKKNKPNGALAAFLANNIRAATGRSIIPQAN